MIRPRVNVHTRARRRLNARRREAEIGGLEPSRPALGAVATKSPATMCPALRKAGEARRAARRYPRPPQPAEENESVASGLATIDSIPCAPPLWTTRTRPRGVPIRRGNGRRYGRSRTKTGRRAASAGAGREKNRPARLSRSSTDCRHAAYRRARRAGFRTRGGHRRRPGAVAVHHVGLRCAACRTTWRALKPPGPAWAAHRNAGRGQAPAKARADARRRRRACRRRAVGEQADAMTARGLLARRSST